MAPSRALHGRLPLAHGATAHPREVRRGDAQGARRGRPRVSHERAQGERQAGLADPPQVATLTALALKLLVCLYGELPLPAKIGRLGELVILS